MTDNSNPRASRSILRRVARWSIFGTSGRASVKCRISSKKPCLKPQSIWKTRRRIRKMAGTQIVKCRSWSNGSDCPAHKLAILTPADTCCHTTRRENEAVTNGTHGEDQRFLMAEQTFGPPFYSSINYNWKCLHGGRNERTILTNLENSTMDDFDSKPLSDYLTTQGCSDEEIKQIIAKLREHDKRMVNESVFDSIAAGTFNLKAIIEETQAS